MGRRSRRGLTHRRRSRLLLLALLPIAGALLWVQARWLDELAGAQREATGRHLQGVVERLAGDLQSALGELAEEVLGAEPAQPDAATWPSGVPLREVLPLADEGPVVWAGSSSFVAPDASGRRWRLVLDEERLATRWLPGLLARSLGEAQTEDYHVCVRTVGAGAVVGARGGSRVEDSARVGRVLYRSHPQGPEPNGPPDASIVVSLEPNRWVGALGETWVEAPGPIFVAEARLADALDAETHLGDALLVRPSSRSDRWSLELRHRDGSVELAFARLRRRNALLGGGLLLVLLSGLGVLWAAEQRARRLAEKELAFVAGVSHELRTPLTVLRTAGANLELGAIEGPERVREYGTLIEREATRLSGLVERVLRFSGSRTEAPDVDPAARPWVDVGEALRVALERCAPLRDRCDAAVEVRLGPHARRVRADPEDLVSALHNLLENAIKYGDPGQPIRVTTRREAPSGWVLAVSNLAEPIPARDRARIFEPFERGAHREEDTIPGSGLGLSVVRSIAEAHGGRLELEPTGSDARRVTFALGLPLEQGPGGRATWGPQGELERGSAGERPGEAR